MTSHAEESTTSEPEGFIARTVGWLRAGYPQGVPQQDYVALLGILRRVMTTTELEDVVSQLSSAADAEGQPITRAMVEQQIADVIDGPATPADVTRVSARMAAAGWPMWSPEETSANGDIHRVRPNIVARVVDWLRSGYPSGLPDQDFVPLLALLRRRLTDPEVAQVAHDLEAAGTVPADRVDVGAAIINITSELPSEQDVERVRAYLEEQGWPTDLTR
jgi:hypothetical protein